MAVWLLPGQGAQEPGMGTGLMDIPEVAETVSAASRALGVDVAYLACDAPADEVNDAFNAQALTMAITVGLGRALQARGCSADAFVGFSLGQISGLALSGMLSLDQAFSLLKVRSTAMAEACAAHPGGMTALLGASVAEAEALAQTCAQGQVLVAANHNAPGQVVISGEREALDRAEAAWKESGKRCVRLNTAGAFHSPLMADAGTAVATACEGLAFADPKAPLICNTDARPFTAAEAAHRLERQVQQPVLFQESIEALLGEGRTSFVEVGHGKVLTNLVKRIDRKTERANVGSAEQLETYCAAAATTEKEA
ncbi:MAG: ACP S-malonyltransferase [Eggerthellaceae bacterium]|jgi:[acyl-carrier-protein] S-malonyltransferase